jgi:hypothetical protein
MPIGNASTTTETTTAQRNLDIASGDNHTLELRVEFSLTPEKTLSLITHHTSPICLFTVEIFFLKNVVSSL